MAQTTTLSTSTSGPQTPAARAAQHNMILAALFSKSSGATEPTAMTAFMDWLDTSADPAVWKVRNAANNAWISIATISSAGVFTPLLGAGSVTETMLAAGAVATAKIADGAVTSGKLGSGAVVEAKIGAGAVTVSKLGDLAVATGKIADNAVTSAKMSSTGVAAASYTGANITVDAAGRITAAASGSSGALELVSATSITAVASIDFDLQEDVYCEWRFVLDGVVPASDNQNILMRPGRAGGTTFETGNFGGADMFDSTTGLVDWCIIGAGNGAGTLRGVGTAAGEHGHAVISLGGLGATLAGGFVYDSKCGMIDSSGDSRCTMLRGRYTGTTGRVWDSVRFLCSSGSFEAAGTIKMFALRRAG